MILSEAATALLPPPYLIRNHMLDFHIIGCHFRNVSRVDNLRMPKVRPHFSPLLFLSIVQITIKTEMFMTYNNLTIVYCRFV